MDTDKLASEMTHLCQRRMKAHQEDPALSDFMKVTWEKTQGKVMMLPWEEIRKFSTLAVSAFVVISTLSGDDNGIEAWFGGWRRGSTL